MLTGFSIGLGFSGLCFSFGGSLTGSEIIDPDSVAQLGLLFFRFFVGTEGFGRVVSLSVVARGIVIAVERLRRVGLAKILR